MLETELYSGISIGQNDFPTCHFNTNSLVSMVLLLLLLSYIKLTICKHLGDSYPGILTIQDAESEVVIVIN